MDNLKMILNGVPVRMVLEGAFSEIHIELTEMIENLYDKVKRLGDFQVGNSINPNYSVVKAEFEKIVAELDKYNLKAEQFVETTLKENPNVTYLEILDMLKEEFL